MEQALSRTSSQQAQQQGDLQKAWRMIVKRRWLVLATCTAVPALVLGYTLSQPRIYQAQATVIVEPTAPKILGQSAEVNPLGTGVTGGAADYYNTQLRILQSWSLSEKVVRAHDLGRDARLVGPAGGQLPADQRENRATAALQRSIRVLPVKDSRVFNIGVRHTNPAFAADLANWIVQVYLEQNIRQKLDVTGEARRWVAEQLDEASKKVKGAEQAFYGFRKENNILAVAIEDRQNILTTSLQEFSNALTTARKTRIDLESRLQSVALLIKMDALDAPSPRTSTGVTSSLDVIRNTYLDERRKLAQLEQRYGPKHHEVIYAQTRVEAAKADLEREGQTVMRGMQAEIAGLRAAETRYGAEVERLKEEALKINQREVEYKSLARNAEDAVQLYTSLQKRYNENRLQEQDEANNIRSLDRARVPAIPVEPNIPNAVALAIFMALAASIGLIYLLHFLDRTVKSPEDVEAMTGLPVLGFVPAVEAEGAADRTLKELYILRHPNSTAAESCRVIRTNINFCSPDKPLRSLVVTSSNPVEGKTMSVINIGVIMAQGGARTLIVDSDMRRPRLHKILKVGNERGLSSLIVGEASIEDTVKSTDLPNLFVLPCGPLPPNPAELLQTDRFAALARELLQRFDRILFDSPPLLAVTDGALLSRVVDGTIVVVRSGRTTRDALQRARRHLDSVGAHVTGVVVNDVDLKSARYGGYNYYYYQYYQDRTPNTATAGAGDKA
jgi:succinoglycan biosynthesis transport protein ExoP